jgi:chorismate mutase-like protein
MVERLGWMDEVAMVKQAKGLPVEDVVREGEVLDAMVALGAEVGLSGEVVRGFFAGQIEAAKVCQEEWLARNVRGEVAGEALPDLAGTVRPALDAIGKRMIGALRQARGGGNACCLVEAARDRLAAEGYSQKVIAAAVGGLEAGLGREDLGCD